MKPSRPSVKQAFTSWISRPQMADDLGHESHAAQLCPDAAHCHYPTQSLVPRASCMSMEAADMNLRESEHTHARSRSSRSMALMGWVIRHPSSVESMRLISKEVLLHTNERPWSLHARHRALEHVNCRRSMSSSATAIHLTGNPQAWPPLSSPPADRPCGLRDKKRRLEGRAQRVAWPGAPAVVYGTK